LLPHLVSPLVVLVLLLVLAVVVSVLATNARLLTAVMLRKTFVIKSTSLELVATPLPSLLPLAAPLLLTSVTRTRVTEQQWVVLEVVQQRQTHFLATRRVQDTLVTLPVERLL